MRSTAFNVRDAHARVRQIYDGIQYVLLRGGNCQKQGAHQQRSDPVTPRRTQPARVIVPSSSSSSLSLYIIVGLAPKQKHVAGT